MGTVIEIDGTSTYIPDCFCCFDGGHVIYKKIMHDMPYEFVARCSCIAGRKYSEYIPLVSMVLNQHEYMLDKFTQFYIRHKDSKEVMDVLKKRGLVRDEDVKGA